MAKKAAKEEKLTLAVTKRDVFGKKLKNIRRQGLIPANVFGTTMKSEAVSVPLKEFTYVYRTAKETGIIFLTGLTTELPVLVKHVQRHPVNDAILHVDFRNVDLKKKIETEVPVVLTGESEAVSQKGGVLLQLLKVLKVEALPQDIPHEISVDIAAIKEIGQEIKVSDLQKSTQYEVKDDPTHVIASVVAHKEESVTPETTAATAPEVITAAKVEEGEEAAQTAETPAGEPGKKDASTAEKTPPVKTEEKK